MDKFKGQNMLNFTRCALMKDKKKVVHCFKKVYI